MDTRTPTELKAWRKSRLGWGALMAILPLAGGGIGWLMSNARESAAMGFNVERAMEHMKSEGHPATVRRLDKVENRQAVIIEKVDETLEEIKGIRADIRRIHRRR